MIKGKILHGQEGYKLAEPLWTAVFEGELGAEHAIVSDEHDSDAEHILIYLNDDGPFAAGRIYPHGLGMHMGRIAVAKAHRGERLGDLVIRMLLNYALQNGAACVTVNAAPYAVKLYEKFGFKADGEPVIEAGLERMPMRVWCYDIVFPSDCKHD